MDIGSLLIALALVLLVAAFVARPLIERFNPSAASADGGSSVDDLIAQRESALIELRDLDFDYTTGKVSDDDYAEQRARLVAKGTAILRALAARNGSAPDGFDDEIEKVIAARRQKRKPAHARKDSTPDSLDDEIEKAIAARHQKRKPSAPISAPPAPQTCPHCAARILPGDRFCAKCGAKLTATTEAA